MQNLEKAKHMRNGSLFQCAHISTTQKSQLQPGNVWVVKNALTSAPKRFTSSRTKKSMSATFWHVTFAWIVLMLAHKSHHRSRLNGKRTLSSCTYSIHVRF